MRACTLGLASSFLMIGCASVATTDTGVGPNPRFPAPEHRLIPSFEVARATPWAAGETPRAAAGLDVRPFATGLTHPRWVYVLPNGDVLVAETNGPGKSGITGLKGVAMRVLMTRAGAAVPSPDRIVLLRDADGDGRAELRTDLVTGLHSPFGMALVDGSLYIANAAGLVRVPYTTGTTRIDATPQDVAELPGRGKFNHHWTKSLLASPDGSKLYVGVGSNSNVQDNGAAVEVERANILEIDRATGATRIYASGLRNPVGLAWQPGSQQLWAVVNERDELGNNLVPDYLTHVERGAFYGWPYSYWGGHVDSRVSPQRPDLVARATVPDYGLGNHVAALGLAFNTSATLKSVLGDGAFVGEHGSWNRSDLNGYRVVFVPFAGGMPSGAPRTVLDGFLDGQGNTRGRPVGVAIAGDGALLVADDVGGAVWRMSAH